MTLKSITLLLLISGISCCKKSKVSSTNSVRVTAEKLAAKTFGSDYTIMFNERQNAVLISKVSNPKSQEPYRTIRFAVFKLPSEELIIERTVARCSGVNWTDNDIIEWQRIPGRLAPGQKELEKFIYNISNKHFLNK